MSGSLNLKVAQLSATGTIVGTPNNVRVAGFTVINHGTTHLAGVRFYQLETNGTVGDEIFHANLPSVALNGNSMTQTYSGQTGIYFKNGLYVSVDSSCTGLITYF